MVRAFKEQAAETGYYPRLFAEEKPSIEDIYIKSSQVEAIIRGFGKKPTEKELEIIMRRARSVAWGEIHRQIESLLKKQGEEDAQA